MRDKAIKVLLIEDNPGDVRLIREMLSEVPDTTIELECAGDLSSGLKCLADGGIDVLLVDLSLPDEHGLEVCVKINNQAQNVPIVVLTGLDDETVAIKALQMGAQDYLVKSQVDSRLLFRSIRYAVERKQAEEQLQHSQVLSSLGKMTAAIAHEVNNPLGVILLYSELLMGSDLPPQIKKDIKIIHDQSKRAARIMTSLLTYSRRVAPQMRRFNLNSVIQNTVKMRAYQHKVSNMKVSVNLPDSPVFIRGDSSQLVQVLLNIIMNAEEAVEESGGGDIKITGRVEEGWVKIAVADDGPGIPEENLTQVFHPFFTTKKIGEGTGLGLSTCYGIIMAHNGQINALNNETGGATFIIELPLYSDRDTP